MPRNTPVSVSGAWLSGLSNLIIPLLILLPVLWALLPGGLPNTADGMVHFTRISEIVSSWQDGIFLPRWSLNLGYGLGIPVFIYGPPLSYLLAAAYHSLGFAPEVAFKMMMASALLLGATGLYRLGHVLFGVWAGAVAVAAMIYAPVTLYTLFVQGNTPQLLAWSFLPWALWAIIQIYRTPSRRGQLGYALLLELTVACTLVSHNVVALILSQTIAVLAIVLWLATRRHRSFWLTVAGSVLGLLLSAWFSVPALLETRYVSINAIEEVDYRPHFVPLMELITWPPRLDTGALNPYIPRSLGALQVVMSMVGLVLLTSWAIQRRTPMMETNGNRPLFVRVFWGTTIFMTLYALVCGFMATRWSTPVWELLPFVDVFQFPARWNSFSGLGLAWLAAAVVGLLARRLQPPVAAALILLLVGAALVNLYPQKTPPGSRTLSPYEVVRYEVKSGATGTTSYGEFNPMWAPRPLPHSSLLEDYLAQRPVDRLKGVLPAGASHQVLNVTAHRQLYQITLPAPATISLNLLYFPGWRAEVNQTPVAVHPQDGSGLLTVDLPAGDNTLELTFGPTPLRRTMGLVSTIAWIGFALALTLLQAHRWRVPFLQRENPTLTLPRLGREQSRVEGDTSPPPILVGQKKHRRAEIMAPSPLWGGLGWGYSGMTNLKYI